MPRTRASRKFIVFPVVSRVAEASPESGPASASLLDER